MAEVAVRRTGDGAEVEGATYRWRWSALSDAVTLCSRDGREILTYRLQPAITVAGDGGRGAAGICADVAVEDRRLTVRYTQVNGGATLRLILCFLPEYYVLDAVTYEPAGQEAIVRITYFARWTAGRLTPDAIADTCVIPGGKQLPEQAIFRTAALRDVRFSVGCFGMGAGTFHQQWALPHYLIACYNQAGATTMRPAACIGLGAVPDGSVTVIVDNGCFSYDINLRGDLWGHRRGPATQHFDFPLVTAVAADWYRAGLGYFAALAAEGYARPKPRDAVPAAACWPQYDTWGDQGARGCILDAFDEAHLRRIYDDFRASGLRARLFVIDDKWEGVYGSLEHDSVRFPHFRELLDEIRADGHEIGLWTAFPRCEDYRALGLDESAVLRCPDGTPYVERQDARSWYVFDPTSPVAAAYLAARARHLIETYRPKLVKIDFGYEIPLPDVAAPHDPAHGGERLFQKFLAVIAGALKQADPTVAVLYYCLTPLFAAWIDQCGMDDLWLSAGAYDAGFAKRALLSSWCGAFGVVPYGSSGYDWRSTPEIWLDTAVIGTVGVIAPLAGDACGARATPDHIARYNGIARLARTNPCYRVAFFDAELNDAAAGPRARSWARIEDGEAVVIALRPPAAGAAVAPGLAESSCPVVVGSLTADGIRTTARLGIVPFAAGRVSVRHGGGAAHAIAHRLDGRSVPVAVHVADGQLVVDVSPTLDGAPVELIEIHCE